MDICFVDGKEFITDKRELEKLEQIGRIKAYKGMPKDKEEFLKRCQDSDIIIFVLVQITNEMLDELPKLKILQFMGTGVENFVNVEYAKSKGIKVLNIEAYGSNSVAEFSLGMGISLMRNIAVSNQSMKAGEFTISDLGGPEIEGLNVGILGTGSIGSLVAKKYHLLGANVYGSDVFQSAKLIDEIGITYVEPKELFQKCDLISVHLRLNPENERLINDDYFNLMADGSYFVNPARAEVVDTDALYRALTNGKLKGAAIDVYNREPPQEVDNRIICLDNVIATAHIGFYSYDANRKAVEMSIQSIMKELA